MNTDNEDKIKIYERRLKECCDYIDKLENECEELRDQLASINLVWEQKQRDVEIRSRLTTNNLRNELSIVKHENHALEVANSALKGSISWRITKPLRDFAALFIKG